MSTEAYVWVTRYAPVPTVDSARLVLYGLAEHASADGSNAYPAVGLLARYLGGDNEKNRKKVQRAFKLLEEGGWIICTSGNKYRHRRWKLNYGLVRPNAVTGFAALEKHMDLTQLDGHECPPERNRDGHECPPEMDTSVQQLDTSVREVDTSVTQTVINPINPNEEPASTRQLDRRRDQTARRQANELWKESQRERQQIIDGCALCDSDGRRLDAPPQLVRWKAWCHHNKEQSA